MPPARAPVTPVDPAFTQAAGTNTGNPGGPGIHGCRRYAHRTSSWDGGARGFMRIHPKPRCTVPWTNVTVDPNIALYRLNPGPHCWGPSREGLTQTRPALLTSAEGLLGGGSGRAEDRGVLGPHGWGCCVVGVVRGCVCRVVSS